MIDNRITRLLGVQYPIVQAPMGWIARSTLASAVSNAGGLGIIETSSGRLDEVREEVKKMRGLTDKPFGVNIAQAFVRDPDIVSFVVEGGEGGGFKNPREVALMVLLPLIASKTDKPIIAAGGMLDGRTMAAAFALGAEGIQMGPRRVSSAESPVHQNWKDAIVAAAETDTVFLNRFGPGPALRALRTGKTTEMEINPPAAGAMPEMARALELYFGGDMEASIALSGQVAGRI